MRLFKAIVPVLIGLLLPVATFAQATELTIDRSAGPTRLGLKGEVGRYYLLEGASELGTPSSWKRLLSLTLNSNVHNWFDSGAASTPSRFYRVAELADSPQPAVAQNFRLIDHLGRSRELYYHTNRGIVLIFTGNGCLKAQEMVATIKSLRDQFGSQGILFWMIDSNSEDNRSNIVAEANALGINLPILHDSAQLVARAYNATATPEAFGIDTATWTIFYQGAIDDRNGATTDPTTQHYLADALTNFLAGRPAIVTQAAPEGCDITLNPGQTLSYSTDIAPLLLDKCVRCHSPGNIAPFAMTNYGIIQGYALLIKGQILTGEMPPWHADPFSGSFTNDVSLTPQEAGMLVQWINDGAPRGNGPDPLAATPPPPTNYPFAWPASLGQPDLVLSIPLQNIPTSGVVDYRYLNVTTTFPTDTWIRAAVIRPGNRKVVHHCLVFFGSDAVFKGLLGFFAGYVPGYDPVASPAGTAKFLPRGTVLQFQMHYITTGRAETDQTQIGLYVSPTPPTATLQTKSAPNVGFSIPPGSPETIATANYTFTKDSLLYEMSPHMHLRGSWFRYEAVYPDNSRETLLSVPRYEFHWQTLYRLTQPKLMPAGTQLICTGAWDNSAQNAENPDPAATVTFGDQTFNEMFIGYFNFAEVP